MKVEVIKRRLALKEAQLEEAYNAYFALLKGGVKSYAIGSRNLTRFDLPQIEETIKALEDEVDTLTNLLEGGSRRKAIRVVPRDL